MKQTTKLSSDNHNSRQPSFRQTGFSELSIAPVLQAYATGAKGSLLLYDRYHKKK